MGWKEKTISKAGREVLGVCSQQTNLPKPTWPNSTHRVGLVFRAWWVGLGYTFFLERVGLDLGHKISNPPNPTRPTHIFNIYI